MFKIYFTILLLFLLHNFYVFGNYETNASNIVKDYDLLKIELLEMKKEMSKQNEKLSSLSDLKRKVDSLEKTVLDQKETIQALQTIVDSGDSKNRTNDKCLKETSLVRNVEKSAAVQQTRENRQTSNFSAFYAYASKNIAIGNIHHVLVFDVVKVNFGNAYNKYSGDFVASSDGLYVFTCTISVNGPNSFGSFEIVKNDEVEGVFFADAEHTNNVVYSSYTTISTLHRGDVVFVRISGNGYYGYISSQPWGRTSFVGWKLQ